MSSDHAHNCPCADPITQLRQLFVNKTMGTRINAGQDPVRRAVFLKPHGGAKATWWVRPDLPAELRVGLLAYDQLAAWLRFSSDTVPFASDLGTTLGVGIKLFGVHGRKLLTGEEAALTHDLVLQNYPVFFVDTAKDMCEFTYEGLVGDGYDAYLAKHPKTRKILDLMQQNLASVFDAVYWSGLPYAFGQGRYVKYRLAFETLNPQPPNNSQLNPNFLHDDLRSRLLAGPIDLHFSIQLRTNPKLMPLDAATVEWSTELAPPLHVATLTLPQQDIDAPGQAAYVENLAFNPWHALPEHAPVGSISEARKVVYQASAELRRQRNGIPIVEPRQPRHDLT